MDENLLNLNSVIMHNVGYGTYQLTDGENI